MQACLRRLIGALALWPLLALTAQAATSLRGMETGEDFRLGPVLSTGLPLGIDEPGDRQFYSLSLQGESPNHGFSRFYLRVISLYELLDLPRLNDTSGAIERQVRFHHQFVTLGLESPLFYELSSPLNFEVGWSLGFSLARVTFKNPVKPAGTGITSVFSDYPEITPSELGAQQKLNPAQPDAQFIGAELGFYTRFYHFYPFVPYAGVRANIGSYLDAPALINGVEPKVASTTGTTGTTPTQPVTTTRSRSYQSGFKFSPVGSLGLDFYLGSRGLLGIEASFWNWDISGRPQDSTFFVSLKAGFLF